MNIDHTLIGLTGIIGSGKTTASRELADDEVAIIDFDHINRQLLQLPHNQAFLQDNFAGMSSEQIKKHIWQNEWQRKLLEQHMHPQIDAIAKDQLEKIPKGSLVILDIPLLLRSDWLGRCQPIIVVTADTLVLSQRLAKRDHLSLDELILAKKSQPADAFARTRADYLLDNHYQTDHLIWQMKYLINRLKNRSQ